MKKQNLKITSLYLNEAEYKKASDILLMKEGLSLSYFIRQTIKKYLKKHG